MKKSCLIPFIIILNIVFIQFLSAQQKETVIKDIPALEFIEKIENLESPFEIIDVRTRQEFNSGKIRGALNLDFYNPDFKKELSKLDKEKAYFVYCRSGNRSGQAASIMEDMGFKEIYNLSGGVVRDSSILKLEK